MISTNKRLFLGFSIAALLALHVHTQVVTTSEAQFSLPSDLVLDTSDPTKLYEGILPPGADKVILFIQGGPSLSLQGAVEKIINLAKSTPPSLGLLLVHQVQTLQPSFFGNRNITFEEAKAIQKKSVDIIKQVVTYLTNKKKKVYLVGFSGGGLLLQEYIATFGLKEVEKVLIGVSRLDLEESFWKIYSQGIYVMFDKPGYKKLKMLFRKDISDRNMPILAAGLGYNRYTAKLQNVDLSKVTYVHANEDQNIGLTTEEEQNFLRSKNATVIELAGDHSEVPEKVLPRVAEFLGIVPKSLATKLDEIKDNLGGTGGAIILVKKGNLPAQVAVTGTSSLFENLIPDMSMGIGSNTKTFTAVLIFKLIEENKLKLTDTIGSLLPELKGKASYNPKITVAQLLNHSSGISDYPLDPLVQKFLDDPSKMPGIIQSQNAVIEGAGTPRFVPGTKSEYSNTGYHLLGKIIETKNAKPYHQVLREDIFTPLGMKNSFLAGYESSVGKVASSYYEGQSMEELPREKWEGYAWSAGSIFSTVEDMATFYSSLFNYKLINASSLKKMLTTTSLQDLDQKNLLHMTVKKASGIFAFSYKNKVLYGHSGKTFLIYLSFAGYDEKTKTIYVIFMNQSEYRSATSVNPYEEILVKLLEE